MATFKYLQSQPLAFTLPDGQEFILTQGKIFELPSENAYIRDIVEQGYLEKVQQPEQPVEVADSKPDSKQKRSFQKR